MDSPVITPAMFQFLNELEENNNRPWFNENKARYQEGHLTMKAFTEVLMNEMSHHDHIERIRLHRIYRDVRFSKNKLPYKSNMSGGMKRATKLLRGGYYFHIEPGASMIGGGFYQPNAEDLNLIRKQIEMDVSPLRKVINSKLFKDYFGELLGEQLKTVPRGFEKDDPNIDLLRYKSFYVMHRFTDQEVMSEDFEDKVIQGYKNLQSFFETMTNYLTTDLNGESTI